MTDQRAARPVSHADATFLALEQARRGYSAQRRIGVTRTAVRRLVAVLTADDPTERVERITRRPVHQSR